jgi:hypothetical protein
MPNFIDMCTKILLRGTIMSSANSLSHAGGQAMDRDVFPSWENARGRLFYGDLLVKEFHQPAPFQRLVLDAFQKSDWKSRIDDPLPWDENVDRQERLRNIAKGLNRDQIIPILRFWTDGTGTGICWALRQPAHRRAPARPRLPVRHVRSSTD